MSRRQRIECCSRRECDAVVRPEHIAVAVMRKDVEIGCTKTKIVEAVHGVEPLSASQQRREVLIK